MSRSLRVATASALALLCQALAAAPDSDATERERIAADRQLVEARFQAARQDCETRFVVNRCLDEARQARRAALEPLQHQLHLLDDARRRARAVERLRSIQAKESAVAAIPALAANTPASAAASAALRPALRRAVRAAPSASAAALSAQQRQAQQQQRLKDAQAHQDAVDARNARRDARRKPAASLPVPVSGAPSP